MAARFLDRLFGADFWNFPNFLINSVGAQNAEMFFPVLPNQTSLDLT